MTCAFVFSLGLWTITERRLLNSDYVALSLCLTLRVIHRCTQELLLLRQSLVQSSHEGLHLINFGSLSVPLSDLYDRMKLTRVVMDHADSHHTALI